MHEKSVFILNLIGSLGFNVFQNMGLVGILCIFLPKWFAGEDLHMTDSFTLLAIVYYLFFNVNGLTYQSYSSMCRFFDMLGRFSEVLGMEEINQQRKECILDSEPAICIKDGQYTWGFSKKELKAEKMSSSRAKMNLKQIDTPVLRNINVELDSNDLLVVIGKIGSGKSSFLFSIMDETIKKSGTHAVNGKIAFVEQEPFIFPGTISENICFGYKFAECRYRKAVVAA